MTGRDRSTTCMAKRPDQPIYCTLPVPWDEIEHKGPHGWDYEKGERATITRRELDAQREAAGLGHLNERLRWLESLPPDPGSAAG